MGTALAALASLLGAAFPVAADAPARLVLLRSVDAEVPTGLLAQVDEAVLRSVSTGTRFSATFASPIPFEDIQLAAGCVARDTSCMRRISATLGADWFLIRELARDGSGRVFVRLTAQDGPDALTTRRAVAEVASTGERAPDRVVPALLERLYAPELRDAQAVSQLSSGPSGASPAPAATPGATPGAERALAPEPAPAAPVGARAAGPRHDAAGGARHGGSPAAIAGWTSALIGGGLLAGGLALEALSRSDHRDYGRIELLETDDVDRADDLLDRSRRRARVANALLISGAAAAAAGVATLLWTYLQPQRSRSDARAMAVELSPARAGASLSLRGAWHGGP